MALDRAMAERAACDGVVIYRLYRWTDSTISFGANESVARTWDRAAIEHTATPCVRRPTGGRAVWHDQADLTYAAGAPLAAMGGLRLAYRVIHEQLARAATSVGIDARVAPALHRPTLAPGACFDLAVGGEVMWSSRKAIGSAQAVFGPALLQHGAIAVADRRAQLARFALNHEVAAADGAEPPIDVGALSAAIAGVWRDAGARPIAARVTDELVAGAATWEPHFRDVAWTWRR